MQIDKKLLDDMAKVAGSAMGAMAEFTKEAEVNLKKNLERVMRRMDFVPREEFEVARQMAASARQSQQVLERRISALEKKLGVKTQAPKKNAVKGAVKKARPAKAKKSKAKK